LPNPFKIYPPLKACPVFYLKLAIIAQYLHGLGTFLGDEIGKNKGSLALNHRKLLIFGKLTIYKSKVDLKIGQG
jgi:hypothetical protein